MATDRISEVLDRYGELASDNVWRVQGTPVIKHSCLERIAAKARIRFDLPNVLRAERDEAALLVVGRMGEDRIEWSIGEALIGVNYRVSGKQAAYVWAMAEKRAKDRVILKLIELHGLAYSEEEADEFREREQPARQQSAEVVPMRRDDEASPDQDAATLKAKIDAVKTVNAITDLMLDPATQKSLNRMAPGSRDGVREHAKARLIALGWPAKNTAKVGEPA